jgi:hypothetical protein
MQNGTYFNKFLGLWTLDAKQAYSEGSSGGSAAAGKSFLVKISRWVITQFGMMTRIGDSIQASFWIKLYHARLHSH